MRKLQYLCIILLFAACSDSKEGGNNNNGSTSANSVSGAEAFVFEVQGQARTTEAGGEAQLFLSLVQQPADSVVVTLESSDPGEATISPAQLTFTADNFNAPQLILVSGVDDDEADGNVAYSVSVVSVDGDPAYAEATASVELTNVDDDSAGVSSTLPSGQTREDGQQATFELVLNSQPTADVLIAVSSAVPEEGTFGPAMLTFTPENWRAPQTVTATGVDDDLDDGDQLFAAQFEVSSQDTDYDGIPVDPVELTNIDDDTASVSVSAISGEVNEDGGSGVFELTLNAQPDQDVTVTFSLSDPAEAALAETSVTFPVASWQDPQQVTITGLDDDVVDGNQPIDLVFDPIENAGGTYQGVTIDPVQFLNYDNDTAGFVVTALSNDPAEDGTTATFDLTLRSRPSDNVEIRFNVDRPQEVMISATRLIFSPTNWDRPKTVTLTGLDDDIDDGDQPFSVVFQPATSNDADYDGLPTPAVMASNLDDDSLGLSMMLDTATIAEGGMPATLTLVLASEPVGDVTVSLAFSDPMEATATPTDVTFTAADWNVPQMVMIDAVDDGEIEPDQMIDLVATIASTDPLYAALIPAPIPMTVTSDDVAGVSVTMVSGDTNEDGQSATFDILLGARPNAPVTVDFASDTPTEGITTSTTVTIQPGSWRNPRTVTIQGQPDNVFDPDVDYQIVFQPSSSADPLFDGIAVPPIQLTNLNTDPQPLTNTVTFSQHVYATLDDWPIDDPYDNSAQTNCQRTPLPLPFGWEIAPRENSIINNVARAHVWGTLCLVFADGLDEPTAQPSSSCVLTNALVEMNGTYIPDQCARRILIRRPL